VYIPVVRILQSAQHAPAPSTPPLFQRAWLENG
jgi:hypothetical protein